MPRKQKTASRWRHASIQRQKILFCLQAGLVIGWSRSLRRQQRILHTLPAELRQIERCHLYRAIDHFKQERLVDYVEDQNGTVKITLSELGEKRVLAYQIDNLSIDKPKKWDHQWRVVFFDIPEKKRAVRDALRTKLKDLNFLELQKSVWVHPYASFDQIDFIVEFFEARLYVHRAKLTNVTNEAALKLHFQIFDD